jgi:2-pyrone-4,6-dicarboxylate lactonase
MAEVQVMDANWIPFHPNPSKPKLVLPKGAVDAHCHVFGPAAQFPFAPERKYTPCDASAAQLFALRDFLGFERNVIVQASCHGKDNTATIDAIRQSNGKARGVAVVRHDITLDELREMHEGGIRGVRFNFVKRLVDSTPKENYLRVAEKIAQLGWHIVVYFEAQDLADLVPFLNELPADLVVDHMGTPKVANGIDHPDFQRFIKLMADNKHVWTKVTCPERLSLTGPPYDDVIPFGAEIVKLFPDQVLWGTDWPHPNMRTHAPDDGYLVDYIAKIAPTEAQRQKLLVDNPMRLYWPEEV